MWSLRVQRNYTVTPHTNDNHYDMKEKESTQVLNTLSNLIS